MMLLASITIQAQRVIQFNDQNTQFISGGAIAGVTEGQIIIAADTQISTGKLFALGYDSMRRMSQLYEVSSVGGLLTARKVGKATGAINLPRTVNMIFDFVPGDDQHVRVVGADGPEYIMDATYGTVSSPRLKAANAGEMTRGVNDLLLYPNRVVYKTNIQLPFAMTGTVYIDALDMTGHVVHSVQEVNWTNMITYDMSNFAPGQYTLRVYATNLGVHDLKVEKQ